MAFDYAGASATSSKRSPQLASILAKLLKYEQSTNIAEDLSEDGENGLKEIGHEVVRKYEIDKRSRSDWEKSAERAMDIALQVRQPKNYPFPNAANIKYPLVTVAALQFGARAYPAIVDGNRIVKAQVMGRDDGVPKQGPDGQPIPEMAPGPDGQPTGQPVWEVQPGAKRAKADRVSQHMSWQLMNEMEEWEEDTDVLLHHLPIVGCCFRKVWRSEELARNCSEMVPAMNLVVNNRVRSLDQPVPVTHEIFLYPQDIEDRRRSGTFLDVDLPSPVANPENENEQFDGSDTDAPHLFLEQHRYVDLDGDGYREPYIITVHKDSATVVRIVANYTMDEIKDDGKRITRIPKQQYFVKYSFIPDPKGGFYDIGFGKLLESLGETIDTTINQMLDAGHLQVAGGGLIGTGVRLKKNKITVTPGVYEQVELSGKIGDQVHTHQFPGPSAVLFNLLGMMVEAARDITAVKDILTGDTGDKGVQTATTTLAMIEQGLKVFTAIYKRVYRALKDEFKLLFRLNAKHINEQEYFTLLDTPNVVAKSDYDIKSLDICPQADPKMVTDMQRSTRANVLMQIGGSPLGVAQNPVEALKRVYDVLGVEEPEKLIMQQQGPTPQDMLAAAEIKKKESEAAKNVATAEKTMVDAHLAPIKAEHEATMAENEVLLKAADHDRQHKHKLMDGINAGLDRDHQAEQSDAQREHDVGLADKAMQAKKKQGESVG